MIAWTCSVCTQANPVRVTAEMSCSAWLGQDWSSQPTRFPTESSTAAICPDCMSSVRCSLWSASCGRRPWSFHRRHGDVVVLEARWTSYTRCLLDFHTGQMVQAKQSPGMGQRAQPGPHRFGVPVCNVTCGIHAGYLQGSMLDSPCERRHPVSAGWSPHERRANPRMGKPCPEQPARHWFNRQWSAASFRKSTSTPAARVSNPADGYKRPLRWNCPRMGSFHAPGIRHGVVPPDCRR